MLIYADTHQFSLAEHSSPTNQKVLSNFSSNGDVVDVAHLKVDSFITKTKRHPFFYGGVNLFAPSLVSTLGLVCFFRWSNEIHKPELIHFSSEYRNTISICLKHSLASNHKQLQLVCPRDVFQNNACRCFFFLIPK